MADNLRESLLLTIHNAEFMCRVEHKCKNAVDCFGCDLFKKDCVKGYVADRLLERFNISEKGADGNG